MREEDILALLESEREARYAADLRLPARKLTLAFSRLR